MSVEVKILEPPNGSEVAMHIESFTVYQFLHADTVRFFPEGRFEFLFQVNAQFLHRSHLDSTWIKRPKAFIGGLHDRAYHVKPLSAGTSCIGVKFKPDSAKYFIPRKLNSLRNRVVSIEDIWKGEGSALVTKMKATADHDAHLRHIDGFLAHQFRTDVMTSFTACCSSLQNHNYNQSVRQMAANAKLSDAHFRKTFHEQVGVSPSKYRKILRVAHAREKLRRNEFKTLTELALNLGYFDQAHFIREFKSITGLTPRKYFSELA